MSLRSKLTKVTNLMIIISFYALTSVAQVEYLPSEEFYILPEGPLYLVPPRRSSVTFHEDWIPQKLMVEFQDRYDEKIGPIESSFVNKEFVPKGSFLLGLNSEYLQTFIQSEAIREHGVYMLSRSMEYRFDEYIKRNHHLKPVYFLKKRLTQREIDVGIDEKIKIMAALAGGRVIVSFEPHYAQFYIFVDVFNAEAGNLTYTIKKQRIIEKWDFKVLMTQMDGLIKTILKRQLNKHWSVSFTISQYVDWAKRPDQEESQLVGFAYDN